MALFILLFFTFLSCKQVTEKQKADVLLPEYLKGHFEDDYGIHYWIDDRSIKLLPDDKYHILEVNDKAKYILLQNDSLNDYAPSFFSRLDYLELENMVPYRWAFCFSSYNAKDISIARQENPANRSDLMKGCNGFPFSRMKLVEKEH